MHRVSKEVLNKSIQSRIYRAAEFCSLASKIRFYAFKFRFGASERIFHMEIDGNISIRSRESAESINIVDFTYMYFEFLKIIYENDILITGICHSNGGSLVFDDEPDATVKLVSYLIRISNTNRQSIDC